MPQPTAPQFRSAAADSQPDRAVLARREADARPFQRLPHERRCESVAGQGAGLELPDRDDADTGGAREIGRRPVQEHSRFAALCRTHVGNTGV